MKENKMSNFSVMYPLEFNNVSNGYEVISQENLQELTRFNLKNILLTIPGERIMDPNFGVGVKMYLFEQNNGDLSPLMFSIKSQIKRYAPYIEILDLNAKTFDNNLTISIRYEVKAANISDILELDITS
jgi:hypothetical protein